MPGGDVGGDGGAKLVIRNTFLELFDDTPVEASSTRRPRAQTDELHHNRAPRKVSYSAPTGGTGCTRTSRPAEAAVQAAVGWPPMGFGQMPGMYMPGMEACGGAGMPPMMMMPPGGGMPPYPGWGGWPWMYPAGAVTGPYGYLATPADVGAEGAHRGSSSSGKGRGKGEQKAAGAVGKAKASCAQQPRQLAVVEDGAGATVAASPSSPPPPPVNGTTVMLRNIPNRYTQSMLLALIDENGFQNCYDFIYLPMDFRNGVNLGYAFVNVLRHEDALRLTEVFQGFSRWFFDSAKVCEVSWAHPHQGLDEHIDRYRNSPVMHPTMPEEYKPLIFKDGVRIAFPAPTKAIRAPKLRPVHDKPGAGS